MTKTLLPESEASVDGSAPSSLAHPLEGKFREPRESDSEEEVEEAEAGAPVPIAPKCPRETIDKRSGKKAKTAPTLVQTKMTSLAKSAPAKATPSESAKDPELDDCIMLSESEDEDLPWIKG
jgi:hypothetical protein